MTELQMTANSESVAGAPAARAKDWTAIEWKKVEAQVKRLQMRIAKATREKKYNKVKALQWMLTHSHSAKLVAVRRVTSNKGARTPGIDGVVWKTSKKKMAAVAELKRHGYRAKPLRRIYIPKQNGKRPIDIPVMKCRAIQALYLLALEPVSETTADPNSYGFRPMRSTWDAREQCFISLARKTSAKYVLEGDIKSCFNEISHAWLLNNVLIDRQMLREWLKSGYLDKQVYYPTETGSGQGGIISPCLANLALDGLEAAAKAASEGSKINVIRYADDFVVTGTTPMVLEKVKTEIAKFLKERGLTLSPQKTQITSIYDGFDFLGFSVRKYNEKLLIKPTKNSLKKLRATVKEVARRSGSLTTEQFIAQLNPKLRGWANYYRSSVSSKAYAAIDDAVYKTVWHWAKRRHPNKGKRWIAAKYFRTIGLRNWVFSTRVSDPRKKQQWLDLVKVSSTPIRRHVKIRAQATSYDPEYIEYFEERRLKKGRPIRRG
jgi:RNA-directed DNA polymerase